MDTTSQINAKELAFSNLHMHYMTGRSNLISGIGRDKKFEYLSGVMTDIGELGHDEWIQKAEAVIAQYGEQSIQGELLQWLGEHNYSKATKSQLKLDALKLHMARIFDDPQWCHYIPWNRRFRPGFIDEGALVWIRTICCRKPGQTTRVQINSGYRHTVCCPHCGRHSMFVECDQDGTPSERSIAQLAERIATGYHPGAPCDFCIHDNCNKEQGGLYCLQGVKGFLQTSMRDTEAMI